METNNEITTQHLDALLAKPAFVREETETQKAMSDMLSQCDGPVTQFVVIHRAIELAYLNTFDIETISNALSDALDELNKSGDYFPTNEY